MNTTAGGGPRRRTCLAAAAALPLATLAGCTTPAPAGGRSVTILHFNDTHGRHRPFAVAPGNATAQTGEPRRHEAFDRAGFVGGYAALASAVAEARQRHGADRVLLLHGGDAFSDDLLGNLSGGEATIRCLNALGVDALALGNHDFDYGVRRTRQLQALARFPMRGANVLDEASGEPFLGEPVQRFERGGVRVGLLCLGYHNTPDTASAEHLRGLRFGSGIDAARRWLPALRATSDLVVVLSHQGSAVDRVLARSVPGIDLIVGAHSHDAISPPERVGDSWIVQALSDGAALGEVTVALDAGGRIERVDGRLHVLWADRWAADPGMAALVESLRAPHRAQLEAPLGRAAERIGRRYRAPSPFDVLVGELLIERTGAELALLPGVGYGVSLEPGVVTREALACAAAAPVAGGDGAASRRRPARGARAERHQPAARRPDGPRRRPAADRRFALDARPRRAGRPPGARGAHRRRAARSGAPLPRRHAPGPARRPAPPAQPAAGRGGAAAAADGGRAGRGRPARERHPARAAHERGPARRHRLTAPGGSASACTKTGLPLARFTCRTNGDQTCSSSA